jgi:hypothetical protein
MYSFESEDKTKQNKKKRTKNEKKKDLFLFIYKLRIYRVLTLLLITNQFYTKNYMLSPIFLKKNLFYVISKSK